MKISFKTLILLVVCFLMVVAPFVGSSVSAAPRICPDWGIPGGLGDGSGCFRDDSNSYFNNAYLANGDNYGWIYPALHGSYLPPNAVMPNWHSTWHDTTGWSSGSGAVGWGALGITRSVAESSGDNSTDNQARKQALYNYLYRSNTNQLNTASESGRQWNRMGSAAVVYTMIGEQWGDPARNRNRTVGPDDWNRLEAMLLDNDNITMTHGIHSNRQNTAGVVVDGEFDVARYDWNANRAKLVDSWIFRDKAQGNKIVYVLEVACANPLGEFLGLPDIPPGPTYDLSPSISTPNRDGISIRRGQSATATGSVVNNGPDDAGTKNWWITKVEYAPGTNPAKRARDNNSTINENNLCAELGGSSCVATSQSNNTFNDRQPKTGSSAGYNVPENIAVGTQICFVVSVKSPTHSINNPVWRHSDMRCYVVAPPQYNLNPSVTTSRGGDGAFIEAGDSVDVTTQVINTGGDRSEETVWELTRMVYGPGTTLRTSPNDKRLRNSNSEPCTEFRSAGNPTPTECVRMARWERERWNGGQTRTNGPVSFGNTANLEVGTKVCFVTSVSRPSYAPTPSWRHSAWWCMTVGKKPKVQIWGGDVRAGGRINTSTSSVNGRTYGSWVEYGALSNQVNSLFGSGAGLNRGAGNPTSQRNWSQLTFANTGNPASCVFGCYGFTLASHTLASQFATSVTPDITGGAHDLNNLAGSAGVHRYKVAQGAGDDNYFTLIASTVDQGKTIIIESDDRVVIAGDIVYSEGPYTDVRQIPQVIIRAPSINIQSGVTRVDAWLFAIREGSARGVLNTCSDGPARLTANVCDNQLVINGPVVADEVQLRRTAGSGSQADQRQEPAEIFNLRADAYLWGSVYGSGSNRVQTVHTREFSPRF